jgi:predicted PurR-regulated permease PerM
MSRVVSFVVILVCVLLVTTAFVWVMAPFLLPIFLAILLTVMFRPLHNRLCKRCGGRNRLAAALTTIAVIVIVLAPLLIITARAASEGYMVASRIDKEALGKEGAQRADAALERLRELAAKVGVEIPERERIMQSAAETIESWLAPAALRTTQFIGAGLVGMGVMILSLYFFLADGPSMVYAIMRLMPLDVQYEHQLLDEFYRVSRAVVLGTLSAAVAQGVLAFPAFAIAGLRSVFLLSALTMLLSLIPVVGAAATWGGAAAWLYFCQDSPAAAIAIIVWGTLVASFADYVVKPYVLHGHSNLHPLLALLSVLGGVETLGPIGILVGPMVVAFLQALLNILRTELEAMEKRSQPPSATPAVDRTA